MKIKTSLFALCAFVVGGTTGFSQMPDASPTPGSMPAQPPPPGPGPGPGGPQGGGRDGKMRDKMRENLSPEDRARFGAAREKAMQSPEIQELKKLTDKANRDFFEAMRKKMLEIDPGLADIIKKLEVDKKGRPDGKMDKDGKGEKGKMDRKGGGGPPPPPGLANLTDAEKEKLMAARAKAKEDPAVKAAEQAKEAAKSPEERKAAMQAYRDAMHQAMLKADPTVEPILKKLGPPPPPKGPGGPAGEPAEADADNMGGMGGPP